MNESHTHMPSGLASDAATAPGRYPTYRPRLPWAWWTRNHRYTIYMLRELSSVFVALWAALFLVQLGRLRRGKGAYDDFLAAQRSPGWVLFNAVTFLFALLHSVTWLRLAGVVQTVRLGRRKLPPELVTAGAFAGWAAASLGAAVALLLGGRGDDE